MAIQTPTIADLSNSILVSIQSSMNIIVPLLPQSFTRVLSKSIAAVIIILYKYSGFIFLQQFIQTASADDVSINGRVVNPLSLWADLVGVSPLFSGTPATLTVTYTVVFPSGSIPAGTQLFSSVNGVTYITLTTISLALPATTVDVLAVRTQNSESGSGSAGNLALGDTLLFVGPQPNISDTVIVSGFVTTGADAETSDSFRQRVLDRFQRPPQGGAASDYVIWGRDVSGIVNIYPYTNEGCGGSVDLFVEATPASSGNQDGIPTPAQLSSVLDSVELDVSGLASRRPVNTLVNALPISVITPTVEVINLSSPDLAQTQIDIESAILTFGQEREPFIFGLGVPPRRDRVSRSAISAVVEEIVSQVGGSFGGVNLLEPLLLTPVQLIVLGRGEKVRIDQVNYI